MVDSVLRNAFPWMLALAIAFSLVPLLPAGAATPPSAPQNQTPTWAATVNNPVTFSWTASSDPNGGTVTYVVRGSQDGASYRNLCPADGTRTSAVSCAATLSPTGAHYRWYVHALDSQGEASAGETWEFDLSSQAANQNPGAFDNTAPAHSSNQKNSVTFSWQSSIDPDGDTVTYVVRGHDDTTTTNRNLCPSDGTRTALTSCTIAISPTGRTYTWFVSAEDGRGGAAYSPAKSFFLQTVSNQAPTAPTALTPAKDGTMFNPVTFTWSASTDADGDLLTYVVRGAEDGASGYRNLCPADGSRTSATSCAVNLSPANAFYSWYVSPSDGKVTGPGSETRRFKLASGAATDDKDGDLLTAQQEADQGTTDDDPDYDNDGLSDYVESVHYHSRVHAFCHATQSHCFSPDPEYLPNPKVRDLYVEVDWFSGRPFLSGAVSAIKTAYSTSPLATDIRVHIDIGTYGGGGTILAGDGNIEFNSVSALRDANMVAERRGIYHYLVNACKDPTDIAPGVTYGVADAPGDEVILYDCRLADGNRANDQAEEFMHEVGHNILGWRVNTQACAGTDSMRNPNLGHFNQADDDSDCDLNGSQDLWSHYANADDAMISGGPAAKNRANYVSATWSAVRLDWSVSASTPDCTRPVLIALPLLPVSCAADHGAQAKHSHDAEEWIAYLGASGDPRAGAGPATMGLVGGLMLLGLLVRRRR